MHNVYVPEWCTNNWLLFVVISFVVHICRKRRISPASAPARTWTEISLARRRLSSIYALFSMTQSLTRFMFLSIVLWEDRSQDRTEPHTSHPILVVRYAPRWDHHYARCLARSQVTLHLTSVCNRRLNETHGAQDDFARGQLRARVALEQTGSFLFCEIFNVR